MITREEALRYRAAIVKAAQSLSDEDALAAPLLYNKWAPDIDVEQGDRLLYNDVLYSVLQSHHTQADWTPDVTPSLFAKVLIPDPEVIPEWEQPDSTNPYMAGDKVKHSGKTWVSLVDNNVWEPGAVGTESLWSEVTE